MGQPFVGEIRLVGFNFAPVGWAFCDGSIMAISENETLYNLIGTTYGGDGQQTFQLPNLQGRVPIHMGSNNGDNFVLANTAGEETVTLNIQQMPGHTHPPMGNSASANSASPANNFWGNWADSQFSDLPPAALMNGGTLSPAGGSQPHENMVPFLVVNFIISLFGIFPSQN